MTYGQSIVTNSRALSNSMLGWQFQDAAARIVSSGAVRSYFTIGRQGFIEQDVYAFLLKDVPVDFKLGFLAYTESTEAVNPGIPPLILEARFDYEDGFRTIAIPSLSTVGQWLTYEMVAPTKNKDLRGIEIRIKANKRVRITAIDLLKNSQLLISEDVTDPDSQFGQDPFLFGLEIDMPELR